MKKILIIISILFIFISLFNKLNIFIKNIIIYNIKNSIVSIIKKEKIKLVEEKYGLKNEKITNIEKNKLVGKGFFINNSGYILTNRHIVNSYTGTYLVRYKNNNYPVKVIKILKNKDLSLIKINLKNSNFLQIEKKPNIYIGKKILFFKNNSFFIGHILEKNISLEKNSNNIITTNLKLIPGESGTPLFNNNYKIIGVNTAISNLNKTYTTLINNQIKKEFGL